MSWTSYGTRPTYRRGDRDFLLMGIVFALIGPAPAADRRNSRATTLAYGRHVRFVLFW